MHVAEAFGVGEIVTALMEAIPLPWHEFQISITSAAVLLLAAVLSTQGHFLIALGLLALSVAMQVWVSAQRKRRLEQDRREAAAKARRRVRFEELLDEPAPECPLESPR